MPASNLCGDEWAFFCQLVLKLGIDEKTFNEFLYFLELFTTGNYIVQTQRELHCGTLQGLCELHTDF